MLDPESKLCLAAFVVHRRDHSWRYPCSRAIRHCARCVRLRIRGCHRFVVAAVVATFQHRWITSIRPTRVSATIGSGSCCRTSGGTIPISRRRLVGPSVANMQVSLRRVSLLSRMVARAGGGPACGSILCAPLVIAKSCGCGLGVSLFVHTFEPCHQIEANADDRLARPKL